MPQKWEETMNKKDTKRKGIAKNAVVIDAKRPAALRERTPETKPFLRKTKDNREDAEIETITIADDTDRPHSFAPEFIYPPVFIVSDFHIGSNMVFTLRNGREINKSLSNDMPQHTLDDFISWLAARDAETAQFPYYDVVMNGDFLDLWQAKRPFNDTYQNRLDDIFQSNIRFFTDLARFLASHSRCRFYYVIGNHDDALLDGGHNTDKRFAPNTNHYNLHADFRNRMMSLAGYLQMSGIQEAYSHPFYKIYAKHGHQHDDFNSRNSGRPSSGQELVERFVNRMQEDTTPVFPPLVSPPLVTPADIRPFAEMDSTPNIEFFQYMHCLFHDKSTPNEIKRQIERMMEFLVTENNPVLSAFFVDILAELFIDDFTHNQIGNAMQPETISRNNLEAAVDLNRQRPSRIVIFGHTHIKDQQPASGETDFCYVNSGSWLRHIRFRRQQNWRETGKRCRVLTQPSPLPYVKVSHPGGMRALVELISYRGGGTQSAVTVRLD